MIYPCRYLQQIRYILNEVGGPPEVMDPLWRCELKLTDSTIEWDKCQNTPFKGPCWQKVSKFSSDEKWTEWANQELHRLGKR
jgi:hypothetical protein